MNNKEIMFERFVMFTLLFVISVASYSLVEFLKDDRVGTIIQILTF